MGYGGYSSDAHEAITRSRSTKTDHQVFEQTGRGTNSLMDPKNLKFRESRDSEMHPRALPIVFCLDVTGSMGDIPVHMARQSLPKFMQTILDHGVEDPQVLFMAVGDMTCHDRAPLQIGQFEAEAQLMDGWLTKVDIVKGGGGNGGESYELAAYTIARHTKSDHRDKRGLKGYVFMTGDDAAFPNVRADQVRELIGDNLREDISTAEIFRELRENYEVFFLVPPDHTNNDVARWRGYLGDHVIDVRGALDNICLVSAAIVALGEGKIADLNALAAHLASEGLDRRQAGDIIQAITPYAQTIGKAGVPNPEVTPSDLRRSRSAHA